MKLIQKLQVYVQLPFHYGFGFANLNMLNYTPLFDKGSFWEDLTVYQKQYYKAIAKMYDFTQKYNQKDNDCFCQIIYIAICNAMVSSVF